MDQFLFSCLTYSLDVLSDVSINTIAVGKRKECEMPRMDINAKRRAGAISLAMMEKLKKENNQLKKEVAMFKDSWMRQFSSSG